MGKGVPEVVRAVPTVRGEGDRCVGARCEGGGRWGGRFEGARCNDACCRGDRGRDVLTALRGRALRGRSLWGTVVARARAAGAFAVGRPF